MKKLIVLLTLSNLLYSATTEQVEQYLSLSHAEEDVLLLESQYANIQNSFTQTKNAYDMQLLMIRFKEKLKTQLSEDEMNDILKTYNNVVYLQFTSNQIIQEDFETQKDSLSTLKNDPDYTERLNIINDINHALNKKKIVGIMYDDLMTPFMQNSIGGKNLSDQQIQTKKNAYIQSVIKNSKEQLLYTTKEFTIEELQELLKVVKSSAVAHEKKAIYKATAYAFKDFFLSIASRYDLTKHQPQKQTESNNNNL